VVVAVVLEHLAVAVVLVVVLQVLLEMRPLQMRQPTQVVVAVVQGTTSVQVN
jgi:hypothetical protein